MGNTNNPPGGGNPSTYQHTGTKSVGQEHARYRRTNSWAVGSDNITPPELDRSSTTRQIVHLHNGYQGGEVIPVPRASALLRCVQRGDYGGLARLLNASPADPIRVKQDPRILAALFVEACEREHLDCIELLLQQTRKELRHYRPGIFPMHVAAGAGALDSVELLLSAGFSPRSLDKEGRTPLHHAAASNSLGAEDCVAFLCVVAPSTMATHDKTDRATPLHLAVHTRNPKGILTLLQHGGVPLLNKQDGGGMSPLDVVMASGDPDFVRVLERCGVMTKGQPMRDGWSISSRCRKSFRFNHTHPIDMGRVLAVWERFFENAARRLSNRDHKTVLSGGGEGPHSRGGNGASWESLDNIRQEEGWHGGAWVINANENLGSLSSPRADTGLVERETGSREEGVEGRQGVADEVKESNGNATRENGRTPQGVVQQQEEVGQVAPAAEEWVACWDTSTSTVYYVCLSTGESTWDAPSPGSWPEGHFWDPQHRAYFSVDAKTGDSKWEVSDEHNSWALVDEGGQSLDPGVSPFTLDKQDVFHNATSQHQGGENSHELNDTNLEAVFLLGTVMTNLNREADGSNQSGSELEPRLIGNGSNGEYGENQPKQVWEEESANRGAGSMNLTLSIPPHVSSSWGESEVSESVGSTSDFFDALMEQDNATMEDQQGHQEGGQGNEADRCNRGGQGLQQEGKATESSLPWILWYGQDRHPADHSYYWNEETGETVWELPSEAAGVVQGWSRAWSEEHGAYFLFNHSTGESVWEQPDNGQQHTQ